MEKNQKAEEKKTSLTPRSLRKKTPNPNRVPNLIWTLIFVVWLVFLSGLLSSSKHTPGIYQAIKLDKLLELKKEKLISLEKDIARLQQERDQLKKNRVVQEREARRVLGYVAKDEIVFDFTDSK